MPDRSEPRRPPTTGMQVLVLLAVAGVALVCCAGGVAGLAFFVLQQPPAVVENPPEDPPPPPKEVPAPPAPEPEPMPPAVPAERKFQRTWTAPLGAGAKDSFIVLSDDGKHVFAQDGGGVRVFDAGTGTQTTRLTGTGVPPTGGELLAVGRDKIMLTSPHHPVPTVWHVGGTQAGELLPRQMLPRAPVKMWYAISPDGKSVFAGLKNPTGGPVGSSMYNLFEIGSSQRIGSGMWEPCGVRFTADGSKLFMAEPFGRCRWLKVPGGAQEVGWLYPAAGVANPLVSMSADGGLILYAGAPMALDRGRYLLDGKTGQVLRNVSLDPDSGPSALSADGRWLLGVAGDGVVMAEARTGTELLREAFEAPLTDVTFRADGRAFAAHDAEGNLALYTLRGDPPAKPPAAAPMPLSPVPDALAAVPGPFGGPFPQMGPFPPTPSPFPPTPFPPNPGTVTLRPAPPQLKARWTAPADIGQLALKPDNGPLFSRDGSVIIQNGGTAGVILAYDAADGTPLPGFAGHQGGTESLGWVAPFADRVASSGKDGDVKVWLARSGAPVSDLVFPQLPISGKQTYGSYKAVSPTGRYTMHGRLPPQNGVPGVFRVMDTTTGKDVIEGVWQASSGSGHVSFTPDELRVFVVNGTGKATWYKLPSGEQDVQWGGAGPQPTNRVSSVSADGGRVAFYGKLTTSLEYTVVDGRTGEVVRRLDSPPYQGAVAALSPDGSLVAVPVSEQRDGVQWHVDVMEVATAKKLGRVSPAREAGSDIPIPRFSPDGRSLAVTFRAGKQVALYPPKPDAP